MKRKPTLKEFIKAAQGVLIALVFLGIAVLFAFGWLYILIELSAHLPSLG